MLPLADPSILEKGGGTLSSIALMEWGSNRIKRVVRTTLAAEAYSMVEPAEGVDYLRSLLAEVMCDHYSLKDRDELATNIPAALTTDARSLHDSLTKEGSALRNRRLHLECSTIQGMENCKPIWIPNEIMFADEVTKDVPDEVHSYAREVKASGR